MQELTKEILETIINHEGEDAIHEYLYTIEQEFTTLKDKINKYDPYVKFNCCNKTWRASASQNELFCPICQKEPFGIQLPKNYGLIQPIIEKVIEKLEIEPQMLKSWQKKYEKPEKYVQAVAKWENVKKNAKTIQELDIGFKELVYSTLSSQVAIDRQIDRYYKVDRDRLIKKLKLNRGIKYWVISYVQQIKLYFRHY